MTKNFRFSLSAGVIAGAILFASAQAQAGTVYSTFGASAPTYFAGTGQFVQGPSPSVGTGYQAVADSFTPTLNYDLSSIDVAVSFRGIANVFGTDSATVSLDSNNAGSPGAVLASATITGLPGLTCCAVETINVSGVSISAGTEYWVVVTPNNVDTDDIWNTGAGVPFVFGNEIQASSGGAWTPQSSPQNAFDVIGTATPEPAGLALGAGGFALLAAFARRRRKA
jgi:hypothetical protein